MPDILNLGCGNRPVDNAVNHDWVKHSPHVHIAHDLNVMPWPWADGSFDIILAWAVLEHLKQDLIVSINECWRIARPGATLDIKLPIWNSEQAHDDPTHRWFATLQTMNYFDPSTFQGQNYGFYTPYKWRVDRKNVNKAQTAVAFILTKLPAAQ